MKEHQVGFCLGVLASCIPFVLCGFMIGYNFKQDPKCIQTLPEITIYGEVK